MKGPWVGLLGVGKVFVGFEMGCQAFALVREEAGK